ncbi:uncharacterized protein LOC110252578 [Exaiptasia diaphana]|uniref:EF-hand domain-containing protein n=1 Tax=Exaiptasia diaphana TaxID=2652724 RepID=A0A913Y6V0_EXADI|nr:uncharacterized protein LOC110252578 [Exaiptasia diaphana]KXJ22385.1 hypothetical protein AC249_AIPGENE27424 [Exaiptasia diaphana]
MREIDRTLSTISYSSATGLNDSLQASSFEGQKITENYEEEETKRTGFNSETRAWLQGPLSLTRKGCRFELPMDMKVLENMTPLEYISTYCRINNRRKTLFRHYFMKNDKDKDGHVNHRELLKAMRDLYAQSITVHQVNEILNMLDIAEKSKTITLNMFFAIAAFSERFFYSFLNGGTEDETTRRTVLEETDFGALKWKLEGCNVSDNMKSVLSIL